MIRIANWSDLGTLDAVENHVAGIQNDLKTIAGLDGVNDALASVEQLDNAAVDKGADVETGIHKPGARKGRQDHALRT